VEIRAILRTKCVLWKLIESVDENLTKKNTLLTKRIFQLKI